MESPRDPNKMSLHERSKRIRAGESVEPFLKPFTGNTEWKAVGPTFDAARVREEQETNLKFDATIKDIGELATGEPKPERE